MLLPPCWRGLWGLGEEEPLLMAVMANRRWNRGGGLPSSTRKGMLRFGGARVCGCHYVYQRFLHGVGCAPLLGWWLLEDLLMFMLRHRLRITMQPARVYELHWA